MVTFLFWICLLYYHTTSVGTNTIYGVTTALDCVYFIRRRVCVWPWVSFFYIFFLPFHCVIIIFRGHRKKYTIQPVCVSVAYFPNRLLCDGGGGGGNSLSLILQVFSLYRLPRTISLPPHQWQCSWTLMSVQNTRTIYIYIIFLIYFQIRKFDYDYY